MVVKMMKWSPWPPVSTTPKKFQVKVKPIKMMIDNNNNSNGFETKEDAAVETEEKVVMLEMKWKGPKSSGLVALRRHHHRRNILSERIIRYGVNDIIEWDDNEEFESVCNFLVCQKDNSFSPWDVSFNLLYGQKGEARNKMVVIGTVSLNIAEMASQMKPYVERKLPIALTVAGVASEATLLISMSFMEIRTDSVESVQEPSLPNRDEGFFRKLTKGGKKKKKKKVGEDEVASCSADDHRGSKRFSGESDESTCFDSEGSPDYSTVSTQSESIESTTTTVGKEEEVPSVSSDSEKGAGSVTKLDPDQTSQETQFDSVSKAGFWKKRKLSFRSFKRKEEPLIKKTDGDLITANPEVDKVRIGSVDSVSSKEIINETLVSSSSPNLDIENPKLAIGSWEDKELISRDGQTKLKTNVFFASIDQRSEEAAGESACTALVALIADWLNSNPLKMPTLSEFDNLITEGSSEWRKLCDNEVYLHRFPDKHFDLESVLEAKLRPLSVIPDKSFIGFFCPESFESLKGAMSFDTIWEEISTSSTSNQESEPHVYIVSWNDHFFVLKVEADAYYVIDTLGERLFEGCKQAYILKFDNTTTMTDISKEGDANSKSTTVDEEEGMSRMEVWSGKECCREFIKRFLAAIPLRELEVEEKKGTTLSMISLHQRLQIEFHFSSTTTTTC